MKRVSKLSISEERFKEVTIDIPGEATTYKYDKDDFTSMLLKDFGTHFEAWEISKENFMKIYRGNIKTRKELNFIKELL